jgi:hypothetical protein
VSKRGNRASERVKLQRTSLDRQIAEAKKAGALQAPITAPTPEALKGIFADPARVEKLTAKLLDPIMKIPLGKPEPPPPLKIPVLLDFDSVEAAMPPPPPNPALPRVSPDASIDEVIARISNMRSLRVADLRVHVSHANGCGDPDCCPSGIRVGSRCRVVPRGGDTLYGSVDRDGMIELTGGSQVFKDPSVARLIAATKRALLTLVEHEIDEHLYLAGLGPDPHKIDQQAHSCVAPLGVIESRVSTKEETPFGAQLRFL